MYEEKKIDIWGNFLKDDIYVDLLLYKVDFCLCFKLFILILFSIGFDFKFLKKKCDLVFGFEILILLNLFLIDCYWDNWWKIYI